MAETDPSFPCSLVISIPLPTHRLALAALQALQVDAELSPLVQRSFRLVSPDENEKYGDNSPISIHLPDGNAATDGAQSVIPSTEENSVLRTEYRATTNRMLRVSVNGFIESMGVVLGAMQELDVDVLAEEPRSTRASS